jgi:phosphatidylserine/phosphatidylglycerophosphate/cardiolipin synthase-like enzyme
MRNRPWVARTSWCLLALHIAFAPLGCRAATEDLPQPMEESLDTSSSSWIERIAFVRESTGDVGRLTVRIKGEDITYLDVPVPLWEQFKSAESLGAFYGKNIKNRFERIKGPSLSERFETIPGLATTALVECAFNEDCEPLLLRTISAATGAVRVAAYAFTRTRIAAALAAAHERGADVRVKIDAKQAEYPSAQRVIQFLRDRGIAVTLILVQGDYSAMHNKFVVVDRRYVAAGSYNFTTTAGAANWENLLWVDSPEIAAQYEKAWEAIVSE